jgi:hypothetical protein
MTEQGRSTGRRGASAATAGATAGLSKDARLAELESRLARLEGAPGLRARSRSMMDKVMPPEAGEHFRNAGREQLLGVRSIVDFWIARLDDADSRAAGRSRERETIEIE